MIWVCRAVVAANHNPQNFRLTPEGFEFGFRKFEAENVQKRRSRKHRRSGSAAAGDTMGKVVIVIQPRKLVQQWLLQWQPQLPLHQHPHGMR